MGERTAGKNEINGKEGQKTPFPQNKFLAMALSVVKVVSKKWGLPSPPPVPSSSSPSGVSGGAPAEIEFGAF